MIRPLFALGFALLVFGTGIAHAQQTVAGLEYEFGSFSGIAHDDYYETHCHGGFRVRMPSLGLTIRGDNLLILQDLDEFRRMTEPDRSSGLPTRGIPQPGPRRRWSPEALRQRLESTMRAIGNRSIATGRSHEALGLLRYLYCEGGIIIIQDGIEVLRCDRLWISPVDNRVVAENAELRYATNNQTLIIRGPRLTKTGPRWVGNDVVLTTSTPTEPHYALAIREAEVIERTGEFEVVSRGQSLQIFGSTVMPLPDARFFTGSQSEFPIKSVRGGYNSLLGAQFGITFGLPWNQTGGQLHEWLTGRPAGEFRGEWELGFDWIEQRGTPLEGRLTYGAEGLYEGWTEAFYLDDQGRNLREIKTNVDGSPIGDDHRGMLRTQNRWFLGAKTHVDLQAFYGTDPAIYSEFAPVQYRESELPETSAYLHHAVDNHLLTVGTRFSATDFSYRDDRFLSTRFIEELPVATYQWLAQPIAQTPFDTPIVLDIETEIGQRRSAYDPHVTTPISDRTTRADQLVEVSAPFSLGGFQFRPYLNGRGTFYDDTPTGGDETRIALEGGVQIATRLSRSWSWIDEEGNPQALRHVIAPRITYRNRYRVDDQPMSFFQFDNFNARRARQLGYETSDTLTERELLRFEVRNVLQTRMETEDGTTEPHDLVFFDLAQDVLPNKGRDNAGDPLGLFFYDLLLQPPRGWTPLETFNLAVFGDLDWYRGMQTLDTQLTFGKVLGLNWTAEYRTDQFVDGAVGLGVGTQVLGRWSMFASSRRDLDRDEWLSYNFGLTRSDHDWSISITAVYNPFVDQTTFRIDFLPKLGFGGGRARRRSLGDMRDSYRYDY